MFKVYHENDINELVLLIAAIYIVFWLSVGVFKTLIGSIPSIISYGIALFFVFFSSLRGNLCSKNIKILFPIISILVFLVLLGLINSYYYEYYIRGFLYLLIILFIYLYYTLDKNKKRKYWLIAGITFDMVVVGINTFIQLLINPNAVRWASTGSTEYLDRLTDINFSVFGTYVYFYGVIAYMLYLIFYIKKKGKYSLIAACLYIFLFILNIKASYSIALLIIAFFSFLIVIFCDEKNNYFKIAFIIVIAILMIFLLPTIFNTLANIVTLSNDIRMRAGEMSKFFSGNSISGTEMEYRILLYNDGFKSFFDTYGLGNQIIKTNYILHGHSTIPDLLGSFGIFSITYFLFIKNFTQYFKSNVPSFRKSFISIWLLSYLLLAVLNPMLSATIMLYWFLYVPLVVQS